MSRPRQRLPGLGTQRIATVSVDPARGIAGVIMMQYLPFADAKALAVYDAFERGTYRLIAER